MNFNRTEIFNISNFLSLIRLLLAIPLFFLFQNWTKPGITDTIIILVLFASFTDILDGYLARKLNQITEFGKIIDPLADKVAMTIVLIGFVFNDLLPLYYILLIILRDILILLGGIYIAKKTGKVLPSNMIGKITVLIIGLVILFRLFGLELNNLFFIILFYFSIIMVFISFIVYLLRGFKVIRENQ